MAQPAEISESEKRRAIERAESRVYGTEKAQLEPEDWMYEECELLGYARGTESHNQCLKELIEYEGSG